MIVGIGTDLVDIRRIDGVLKAQPRFAEKVLTPNEFVIWQQKGAQAAYLAKRWAAKEAVFKALGTGLRQGMSFQDVEVSNSPLGAPQLNLQGGTALEAQKRGIKYWHLSLSDEQDYALAYVIAEGA